MDRLMGLPSHDSMTIARFEAAAKKAATTAGVAPRHLDVATVSLKKYMDY